MQNILNSSDPLEKRLVDLEAWSNSPESLSEIYKATDFTESFIQFAMYVLETIRPNKQILISGRHTVFNLLYKMKVKNASHIVKLFSIVTDTIKNDHIWNVSLALKFVAVLSKSNRLDDVQLNDLINAFSCVIEDVMNSFRSSNEVLIIQTLFVCSEVTPFLGLLVRKYTNQVDKFEKITRDLLSFVVMFMNNNEFNAVIINNETILIELINLVFKIVKYFIELIIVSGRDFSTRASVPEICMFIINFCPEKAELMKKEIYSQVTTFCIHHKELFHAYIDIILSENIMIKPHPKNLRTMGLHYSTEIACVYKDKITREALMKLSNTLSIAVQAEFSLADNYNDGNKWNKRVLPQESVDTLKLLMNCMVKVNEIYACQKYSYYEKHMYYLKGLLEIFKIYCGISDSIEMKTDYNITELRLLVKGCVRGMKNIMQYFSSIKESTPSIIHCLKCFSLEEIAKFSFLFNRALSMYTNSMFTEEDRVILEETFVIFVYLEEPLFFNIVSSNLELLFTQTRKNPLLFIIWEFYLGIKAISAPFFSIILNYIINTPMDPENAIFYEMAVNSLLKALHVYPKEIDHVLSQRIENLFQMLLTVEEGKFFHYKILNTVFSYLKDCDTNFPMTYRAISHKLDLLLKTLAKLNMLYPENEVFIQALLTMPTNFVFIISSLKIFTCPVIYALYNNKFREMGLNFLKLCVDNLQHDFIGENTENKLHEIIIALLHCSKEDKYRDQATQIIFKLKAKKALEDFKMLPSQNFGDYSLFMKNDDLELNFDLILFRCFQIIRGVFIAEPYSDTLTNNISVFDYRKCMVEKTTNIHQQRLAYDFISHFIYSSIGWEYFETENIIDRVKHDLTEITKGGFAVFKSPSLVTTTETVKFSHFTRLKNVCMNDIIQAKQFIYDAVVSIFYATNLPFASVVYELLELIYYTIVIYKVVERFKAYKIPSKVYFDYSSFIDPLIECFRDPSIEKGTHYVMTYMYNKMLELTGSKRVLRETFFFQDILSKFTRLCYFKEVNRRNAGLRGIIFIVKNLDLDVDFILNQRTQIFKALFFYLENATPNETNMIKEILQYILRKTFSYENHDFGKKGVFISERMNKGEVKSIKDKRLRFGSKNPDIVYQLIIGLKNHAQSVKLMSQSCIEYLAELRNTDVTEIILSYKNHIMKKINTHKLQNRDIQTLNSLLDFTTYMILLRPPILVYDETIHELTEFILKKFEGHSDQKFSSKIIKFVPCYLKFLHALLSIIVDRQMIERFLLLFIKGLFSNQEIADVSTKALKHARIRHPDIANEFISIHFRPTIQAFLHESTEMVILNSMILILDIINIINTPEIIEKLCEIFKMREDIVLYKSLEIVSLLPPHFSDSFMNEIIDIANFLEQKNKLLSSKKTRGIIKDICEKNIGVIKLLIKRINDFCNYKIMLYLVKSSTIIKNYLKNNLPIEENIYSIILFKEMGVLSSVENCLAVLKVYKEMKQRGKSICEINDYIKTLPLTTEHMNYLYEIDEDFVFNNPQEKFVMSNLSIIARKKLLISYVNGLECRYNESIKDQLDSKVTCVNLNKPTGGTTASEENSNTHNDSKGPISKNNTISVLNSNIKYCDQNVNSFNDEQVREHSNNLKPSKAQYIYTDINVLEGVDKKFFLMLQDMLDSSNIDYEFRSKILSVFYLRRILSDRVIYHCKLLINKNYSLKYKALIYLCSIEPCEAYFDILISSHYEYKKCIDIGLEHILESCDVYKLETTLINAMRNQLIFRNQLYIIYPMIIKNNFLITYKVACEIFDTVCRLFGTILPLHQKLARGLFEQTYEKYKHLYETSEHSKEEIDILNGLSICFTLYFSNACLQKDESYAKRLIKYKTPLNFSFLFIRDDAVNYHALSEALDNELHKSDINDEQVMSARTRVNIARSPNKEKEFDDKSNVSEDDENNLLPNDKNLQESTDVKMPGGFLLNDDIHLIYDMDGYQGNSLELIYKHKVGVYLHAFIKKCLSDPFVRKSFLKYIDMELILQVLGRFIESPENIKTAYCIMLHLINMRMHGLDIRTTDSSLFDIFTRVVNILLTINADFAIEIVERFIDLAPKIQMNQMLIKFLESVLSNDVLKEKNSIIQKSVFLFEDKNIPLADKILLVNAFRYTSGMDLSFILPFFKGKSEVRSVLQHPFLMGLQSDHFELREEFYNLFNESVSSNIFSRLRYLINFEWSLYGDEWLYPFFRMCLMCFGELQLDVFKIYIFGDDSLYENIYDNLIVNENTNNEKIIPNIDMDKYIMENIYTFVSKTKAFKGKDVALTMTNILFYEYDCLKKFLPAFLCELLKKLNSNEMGLLTTDLLKLVQKNDCAGNLYVLFEAFSNLVDLYEKKSSLYYTIKANTADEVNVDEEKNNKKDMENVNNENNQSFYIQENGIEQNIDGGNNTHARKTFEFRNNDNNAYQHETRGDTDNTHDKNNVNENSAVIFNLGQSQNLSSELIMNESTPTYRENYSVIPLEHNDFESLQFDKLSIVKEIRYIISSANFLAVASRANAYVSLLNLVEEKYRKDLYQVLKEKDFYLGALKTRCKFNETLNAIECEQRQENSKAIEIYENLQSRAMEEELIFDEEEYEILEKEWIECAKTLQQWDILNDIGNFMGDCVLSTEASFRNLNFLVEHERINTMSILNLRKNTPEKVFLECFLDFMSGATKPEISNQFGSVVMNNNLKQKLVNLKRQFINVLHTFPLSCPKISEILIYMKCIDEMIRIPDSFDYISYDESVFCWDFFCTFRMHLFDHLIKFDSSKKFFHEKARLCKEFAKILIRAKLDNAALFNLQKIFVLPSIEASDAFKKITGEMNALCINKNYDNAIEIANSCNLNFFDSPRKASIFAWKGKLYEKKGMEDDANRAYLHAIQIDGSLGKNWYLWGLFLNKRFENQLAIMKETRNNLNERKNPESKTLNENENIPKEKLQSDYNQSVEDLNTALSNAFSAFLQAAVLTSGQKSRKSFIRLIKYFKYENESMKQLFVAQRDDLDVSKYFFFIPQLVGLIESDTYFCAQIVLMKLIDRFPQSVFLPFRVAIERKGGMKKAWDTYRKEMNHSSGDSKNSNERGLQSNPRNPHFYNDLRTAESSIAKDEFYNLRGADANNINKNSVYTNMNLSGIKSFGVSGSNAGHNINENTTASFRQGPYSQHNINAARNNQATGNQSGGRQDIYNQFNLSYNSDHAYGSITTPHNNFPGRNNHPIGTSMYSNVNKPCSNSGNNSTAPKSEKNNSDATCNQRITNMMGSSSYFHASTFFTLEKVISDLIAKMGSTMEENCYKMVDAIFNESINKLFGDSPYTLDDLATLLDRLSDAINQSKIHTKYKTEFKKDFYDQADLCLFDLAKRALKWKMIIENILKSVPLHSNLSTVKTVNDYGIHNSSEVQVFGQYSEIKSVYDDFVTIEGFEPAYLNIWKNGNSLKRIIIRGNDGRKYCFIFYAPLSRVYWREDRCVQLAEFMHNEMNIDLRLKSYVYLNDQTRLIKNDEYFLFLDDILNNHAIKNGDRYCDFVIKYVRLLIENNDNDIKDSSVLQRQVNEAFDSTLHNVEGHLGNLQEGSAVKEHNDIRNPKVFGNKIENGVEKVSNVDRKITDGKKESIEILTVFEDQKIEKHHGMVNDAQGVNLLNKDQGIGTGNNINRDVLVDPLGSNESREGDNLMHKKVIIKQINFVFTKKMRFDALKTIMCEIGDSVISNVYSKTYRNSSTCFLFKKNVLTNFSAQTILLYLLAVSLRSPCRMAIGNTTGRIYNVSIFPYLDENYNFKSKEAVPMRITPNLQAYFGREGIEGIFKKIGFELCEKLKENDFFDDLFNIVMREEKECFGSNRDVLKENYNLVMERAERFLTESDKILKESSDPMKLCMMNPLWHPWF